MTQDTVTLPVYRRGKVVAETVVDADAVALIAGRRLVLHSGGYALVRDGNQPAYLHRLLMRDELEPGLEVDHRNRDRLDNRRSNLRIVTHAQNGQNVAGQPHKTSRHRGVSWSNSNNGWIAQARLHGRTHHLGTFASEDEAARVASAWRAEHMPGAIEDAA